MTTGGVLVVGETVIDVVEQDGHRREHVGGSPAIVALTLARLGRPVGFATDLGDDARGERARAHLGASGVRVRATGRGSTSSAVARIGADGSARYDFDLSWDPDPVDPAGASHVHTGSAAVFLAPGAGRVADLIGRLPEGTTLSLDPNIRADLLPSRRDVLGIVEQLLPRCDTVKLSDEDARWLHPGRSVDAVLDALLASGTSLAVVTLGGDGLVLASRAGRVHVPAERVEVVDTVGAGDSAMGALIDARLDAPAAVLDEDELARIGRWAARVAAVTASRAGGDPPLRSHLG
ncbi:carbohydrate kinase family protein [Rathayibacter sp. VKM Ac-2754]|uniref:carbohydrate kinase family protein n=1 Tax=Rathayibacter sp. VKM Ac-2754 TaxID=2609251 RepID=UPI00135A5ABA|nr:carbohydrate kinase [Rathayibacter sp. VKM Ac-2754]MWV58746.1 carbohydrate kinase [Rathayibacter sp. VKM Ac-2754]